MGRRSGQVRFAWVVPGLALAGLPLAIAEWFAQAAPTARAAAAAPQAAAVSAAGSAGAAGVNAVAAAVSAPLAETCRTMGPALVSLVSACVFLGSLAVMVGIFRALRHQGWSLANALSEPTRLLIPDQAGWSDSQGDRKAVDAAGGSQVRAVEVMEASSSRLIATLGSVAILLLYLGFGVFALFDFGLTCTLPATLGTITNFLYAGLALFAPYVANKVSSLFRPGPKGPGAAVSTQSAASASSAQAAEPASGRPEPSRPVGAAAVDAVPAAVHLPGASTVSAAPPHRPPHPIAGAAPAAARPATTPATHPPAPASSAPTSPLPHADAVQTKPPLDSARPATASADSALQPAVALIAQFEGFVDHAYPDPASGGEPWTIGYGFTRLDGRPVRPDDRLDQAQAELLLRQGVQACAAHLAGRIPYWGEMVADQHCALISFAWNLGQDFYGDEADFATISRVLRQRDWSAVPHALCLYINPGSSVSAGLLRRRQAEGALWDRGLAQLSPTAGGSPQAHGAHPNPLRVPWFDQLKMDDGQGWRDCFSASSAMLAAY